MIIQKVYNNDNDDKIYLPVHFTNIITAVKDQFNITSKSLMIIHHWTLIKL